jgi:hypothetical protein
MSRAFSWSFRTRMSSEKLVKSKCSLAVATTLLLLFVSSWASGCELSCSMASGGPRSSTAGRAAMSSSHCGHQSSAHPYDGPRDNRFRATPSCGNAPCLQSPAPSFPAQVQAGKQLPNPVSVVSAPQLRTPSYTPYRASVMQSPPRGSSPGDRVLTSLRI